MAHHRRGNGDRALVDPPVRIFAWWGSDCSRGRTTQFSENGRGPGSPLTCCASCKSPPGRERFPGGSRPPHRSPRKRGVSGGSGRGGA